jgi:biopolymer transport protein ExbB
MFLAQIVNTPQTTDTAISVWDLTLAGGPLMIPIALSSLVAIYIFVERVLTINRANESPDAFMGKIKELVLKGDINSAKMVCSQHDTPVARMIEKGVARIGSPLKNIEASIENVAKIECPNDGFLRHGDRHGASVYIHRTRRRLR